MQISKTCDLIEGDLYFYDFQSCYYNLLRSIQWDISNLPEEKLNRNIAIGLMAKDNPVLAKFLNDSTIRLIDYYIQTNKVQDSDIIIRQKDGLLLKKKLTDTTSAIPLDLRGMVLRLILNLKRTAYLAIYQDGVVSIKGLSNKTVDISFFEMFKNLSFSNKKDLIRGINSIRKKILNGDNPLWYTKKEGEDSYSIPILGLGSVSLSKFVILNMIDIKEIDRITIWNNLVWPFAQTILIYCQ